MQSISLQNDGCITLNVKVNDPNGPSEQYYAFQQSPDSITPRQNRNIRPQVLDHYKKVRCKILLLCIGSKPHQMQYSSMQQIPRGLSIHCDYFLTDRGFTNTMQLANRYRTRGNKKIVILGGNQNAFSSAYLLLKGPCIYSQSENRKSIMQLNDSTITITSNSSHHQQSPLSKDQFNPQNQLDSLSPFLHKRKLEQVNNSQQRPCDRCNALVSHRRTSIHQNTEDTNIFTINNRNTLNPYAQNSQYSSRLSTNTNAYNSSNLGNSYLAKRTGLTKAGMSILNLQNMNNSSTQGLNDTKMQTRNNSLQPQQFNRSNNSSFMFNNNLSTMNSSQNKHGYGSAFQSQSLLKNSDIYLANQQQQQEQECLCLGTIKPLIFRWKKEDVNMIDLSNTEIIIIHSNDIKVHYQNENEAKLIGLWTEQLSQLREKNGEINSQTGLKGDAKGLYLDIKKGYEPRVRLVQTSDEQEIDQIISDSFMCIDATGYINSPPLIKGVQGELYEPKQDSKNMTMIDQKQRILTEKGPIKNIFCMGFFSGVCLSDIEGIQNDQSDERIHNINAYNDIECKKVCSSVLEALQSQEQSDIAWKWIEEVTLSQSQIFNNEGEPDYESANIMNYFARDDELGIDKINKQLRRAKVGINFKGVDSYLNKKYKVPY